MKMSQQIKTNLSIVLPFFCVTTLCVAIFLLSSCKRPQNDKFGKENNEERIKLGLPIVKDGWTLKQGSMYDGAIFYAGPKGHATWFTDSRTGDNTLPYHAYKTIHYIGDTLVAECDTYLNMNYKWFNNGKEMYDSTDTLKKTFEKYHALTIIYVYKQLYTEDKDFSTYDLGFNYTIQGEKDGFSDIQILNSQQSEEILKRWNLKRLNY
jgi:hypothetical protein